MKSGFDAIAYWVLDYYIAATVVLSIVTLAQRRIAQPARRLALHWGTLVGLALLVVLCILPGWPRLDLTMLLRFGSPTQAFVGHHSSIGASAASSTGPGFWSRLVAWDLAWLRLLAVAVFGLGSALTVFRVVHGVLAARRVRFGASRAPRSLIAVLEKLGGKERCPELLVSRSHPIPIATGAFWPKILLPPLFAERERPDDCRSVLAHELAHIRNGDLWLLALDRWLLPLFWMHPLYLRLRRSIRDDQELLADGFAVAHSSRTDYADMLVRWARRLAEEKRARQLAVTVAIWDRPTCLSERISRLLHESASLELRCPRGFRLGSLLSLIALPILLSTASVGPDVPRPSDYVARLFEQQPTPKACPPCHGQEAFVAVRIEHVRYSLEQPAIAEVRQLGGLVNVVRNGYLPFVTEVNMVSHYTEDGHRFENQRLTDEALPHISRFHHLKSLTLAGGQVTEDALRRISRLTELRSVSLRDARLASPDSLALLAKLPHLRSLELTNSRLNDATLARLTKLPALAELSIARSDLTEESLAIAGRMLNLRSLSLELPHQLLTHEDLVGLRSLKDLRRLTLRCAEFTDAAVEEIRELKGLRLLSLGDSRVSLDAVTALCRRTPLLAVQTAQQTLQGSARGSAEQASDDLRRSEDLLARIHEFTDFVGTSRSHAAQLTTMESKELQHRILGLRRIPSLKNVDWKLALIDSKAALAVSTGFSSRHGATLVFTCRLRAVGDEWKIDDFAATSAHCGVAHTVERFAWAYPHARATDEWLGFFVDVLCPPAQAPARAFLPESRS